MDNGELSALEWQFQLYIAGLPLQDRKTYVSRSTLANFSIPEVQAGFIDARRLLNNAWASQAHRISAPEGAVEVHLDFIESPDINAITFGQDGTYFVGITEPFLVLIAESSAALWKADFLQQLLEIEMTDAVTEFLFQVLLMFQFQFIANHELGHLFHGHQKSVFRSEFSPGAASQGNSSVIKQAAELDADGYAVHLLLGGILRGSQAAEICARLGSKLGVEDCILNLFLLSVGALFYFMEPKHFDPSRVRIGDHPFALARMNIILDEVTSYCRLHLKAYEGWASLEQFQWTMACVGAVKASVDRVEMWAAQGDFLKSEEGKAYLTELLTEKIALRASLDESQWALN